MRQRGEMHNEHWKEINIYILSCDHPGRNGRQNKGGAKNYQAFAARKKPGPEPMVASKVR